MPASLVWIRPDVNDLLELGFSAVLAVILIALSKPVALKIGVVSKPREDRWNNSRSVPALGGPALLLAASPFLEIGVVLAMALFCLVGLIDDKFSLTPLMKAMILWVPCGVSAWLLENIWIAPACWIAANAVNMLDHADGVAAGTCMGSFLVAGGGTGFVGTGVCVGFLVHNYPPARVFLGDSGSLMLGALLVFAWMSSGPFLMIAGLAVPLADAAFVVLRRLSSGGLPWIGGTDHSGHVLLRMGVSPELLPILYFGVGAAFALSAKELI